MHINRNYQINVNKLYPKEKNKKLFQLFLKFKLILTMVIIIKIMILEKSNQIKSYYFNRNNNNSKDYK